MKRKTIGKILIDAAMTVLYILLMIDFGGETFFHEAAGILVGLLFIAHVILNWADLKALLARARGGHATPSVFFRLVCAGLLPIFMLAEMATGVLLARSVFSLGVPYDRAVVSTLHTIFAWGGLTVLAVHVALHGKYLAAVFPACFWQRKSENVRMGLRRAGALALAVAVIYAATYSLYAAGSRSDASLSVTDASLTASAEIADTEAVYDESSPIDAALPAGGSERGMGGTRKKKRSDSKSAQSSASDEDSGGNAQQNASSGSGDTPPTLDAFLQAMTCTGCGRHCSLLSPHCGKGVSEQQEATEQYEATYGQA